MPNTLQAVSVGIVILFVVVAMPVVVNGMTGSTSQTVQFDEGETQDLTERLNVTVTNINATANYATVSLEDSATLDSQTETIDEGKESTFTLSGGNVSITVGSIDGGSPETAILSTSTPNQYGWADGASTLADNLGLVIVAVAFIVILGLVGSVIQS